MESKYQAVESIPPGKLPLLRAYQAADRRAGQHGRVMAALLTSLMLASVVVGLAAHKSKQEVSSTKLKGAASFHPTLYMTKHDQHLREREHVASSAVDDDVCETATAVENWNAFTTQALCDSCCSATCKDYISSSGSYLWVCESSSTSGSCSVSYDTFTIYKTAVCYACCENDCTRYLGGDTYMYYFC